MSTETRPDIETESDVDPDPDPYRYGWRYVRHPLDNGEFWVEEVPLPRSGLLFPEESDRAVTNAEHVETCFRLYGHFQMRMRDVPRALVLCDHRVDYAVPDIKPIGPDVAVFLDTADMPEEVATYEIARLHGRPALAVEVTSPDTRINDFGIKKGIYELAGLETYVIVDLRRTGRGIVRSLHGFRNTEDGFEPLPLDDQGRLWIELMHLWLAIVDNRVVCLDGATGEPMNDYPEALAALQLERDRAEAERERAEAERERAEAERERADQQQQAADVERLRADAYQQQVEATAQVTLELEAQVQAMRAEIEKLRGGGA